MAEQPSDQAKLASLAPGRWAQWRDSLQVRVALLLSAALLPLGLPGVLQTQSAVESAAAAFNASLVAETARAARPEMRGILRAQGLAEGLANAMITGRPDAAQCRALMNAVSATHPQFSFVGFIDISRRTDCNNLGQNLDLSDSPASDALLANPRPDIAYDRGDRANGTPQIIVSHPAYAGSGALSGFVSLSYPSRMIQAQSARMSGENAVQIVTLDGDGQLLAVAGDEDHDSLLPADRARTSLAGQGEEVFTARTVTGETRRFALVPILAGEIYALGSRPPGAGGRMLDPNAWTTLLFPAMMWLVSLSVALWALRRQVIRPVRRLHRRIRAFGEGRALTGESVTASAATELRHIGAAFEDLALRVVRNEAEQEIKLRERDILLRELHHRVKNNLQQMSSIINMQIRETRQPEARDALRAVLLRLSSMARFYQDLYAAAAVTQVSADLLIADLTPQILDAAPARIGKTALAPVLDVDPVALSPHQAGQLAMLLTEALSEAVLRAEIPPEDGPGLRVALKTIAGTEPPQLLLRVETPLPDGAAIPDESQNPVLGLAARLIAGFSAQLGATAERRHENGRYVLEFTFEHLPIAPLSQDSGKPSADRAR